MLPVEFDPRAVAEAKAAKRWYARRSVTAAQRFVAELDRAVERIAEAPRRWPSYFLETRVYRLGRFPYLLVYRERSRDVQFVAVAHGRRRPGYWTKRLS
jgi:plasmid stabilization system protein ParE